MKRRRGALAPLGLRTALKIGRGGADGAPLGPLCDVVARPHGAGPVSEAVEGTHGAAKKPETGGQCGCWTASAGPTLSVGGGARYFTRTLHIARTPWAQSREERSMTDQRDSLAREIDEELRREQLLKLWER